MSCLSSDLTLARSLRRKHPAGLNDTITGTKTSLDVVVTDEVSPVSAEADVVAFAGSAGVGTGRPSGLAHQVSELVDGLELGAFYWPYEADGRKESTDYPPKGLSKV